ncbi:DUF116 domain-containing protein [Clostridioides difficile]
MGETVTYSLCQEEESSNKYYEDISFFTNQVIDKVCKSTSIHTKEFRGFIHQNKIECLRSNIEYALELLVLGLLWKVYINKSITLKKIPKSILIKLSKLREKNDIKRTADFCRGILATIFLNKEYKNSIDLTLKNFRKLIDWLSATGEFNQEVKRLKLWVEYLSNKSEKEITDVIQIAINLGEWFEIESDEKLGDYTINVKKFHDKIYDSHKWREDYIYCGRKRVEYHLNMVGAEIMNRCYRKEFLNTKEKRLLIPVCMRLNSNVKCNSIKTKYGYVCKNCTKSCQVNKYTELGQKYDFKVYIIPHESAAFTKEMVDVEDVGIIGVACVLNLISGGWKAKNFGFIPQCIVLDYCGCKNHWHEKGIVTDINVDRLLYTIGIKDTLTYN